MFDPVGKDKKETAESMSSQTVGFIQYYDFKAVKSKRVEMARRTLHAGQRITHINCLSEC